LEWCISGVLYRGLTSICETLVVIPSLKHLKFIDKTMKASVGASLGSMLAKNSTLEHLDLGECTMSPTGIAALLRPLTGAQQELPVNTSLKRISVPSVSEHDIGHKVGKVVAGMLRSNKTLTHLSLAGHVFSEPSDVCVVLQSLRTNETLQTLDLVGCDSHFEWEEDVFAEMLHLTQANLVLESIDLSTWQFGEGHIEAVKAQLAANAIKRSGTNVENLRERAVHNPMMAEFEVEVPQEILECRPSDSLEIGVDNLEVSACE
jgi:Ran GTPase-activating protein (RanGAP) involved in mRNA processing and transport